MTIYEELVERVSNGETFHIDFAKRTMKVGKDYLIKNGEYDATKHLVPDSYVLPYIGMELILGCIGTLYAIYKCSLPSERSDKKRRTYFKALSMDELSDIQLLQAERREIAQARLEGYILCMILEKKFIWDEDIMGKWFYQAKGDSDLIILRKWIEKGE